MGLPLGWSGRTLLAAEGSAAGSRSPPWNTGRPDADPVPGEGGTSRPLASLKAECVPAGIDAAAAQGASIVAVAIGKVLRQGRERSTSNSVSTRVFSC
eukprot:5502478-Alexandrium_andersonii.AAC.1